MTKRETSATAGCLDLSPTHHPHARSRDPGLTTRFRHRATRKFELPPTGSCPLHSSVQKRVARCTSLAFSRLRRRVSCVASELSLRASPTPGSDSSIHSQKKSERLHRRHDPQIVRYPRGRGHLCPAAGRRDRPDGVSSFPHGDGQPPQEGKTIANLQTFFQHPRVGPHVP